MRSIVPTSAACERLPGQLGNHQKSRTRRWAMCLLVLSLGCSFAFAPQLNQQVVAQEEGGSDSSTESVYVLFLAFHAQR